LLNTNLQAQISPMARLGARHTEPCLTTVPRRLRAGCGSGGLCTQRACCVRQWRSMPRAEAARYVATARFLLCRLLEHLCRLSVAHARPHVAAAVTAVAFLAAAVEAFAPAAAPALRSKVAMSKMAPQMSMEYSVVEQVSTTLAGVVAVDGGTVGLDVSFGAFLAVILGLFIPVVFLVTLYIQSDAQGTATTFRQPDSIGGTRFEDE
jgi:photosystem II PsbM protein